MCNIHRPCPTKSSSDTIPPALSLSHRSRGPPLLIRLPFSSSPRYWEWSPHGDACQCCLHHTRGGDTSGVPKEAAGDPADGTIIGQGGIPKQGSVLTQTPAGLRVTFTRSAGVNMWRWKKQDTREAARAEPRRDANARLEFCLQGWSRGHMVALEMHQDCSCAFYRSLPPFFPLQPQWNNSYLLSNSSHSLKLIYQTGTLVCE